MVFVDGKPMKQVPLYICLPKMAKNGSKQMGKRYTSV